MDETRLITLFASGGQIFVWNADEAFKIRSKYRTIGSLVGSLPRKPKQNLCFSLPLVLMREEATLLLEKGFARIVDASKASSKPSAEEVKRFNILREESVQKQLELFREEREKKQKELSGAIEAGRKRKRGNQGKDDEGEKTPAKLPKLIKDPSQSEGLGLNVEKKEVQDNSSQDFTSHVLKDTFSGTELQSRCMQKEGQLYLNCPYEERSVSASHSAKTETVITQELSCLEGNGGQLVKCKVTANDTTENADQDIDTVTAKSEVDGPKPLHSEQGALSVLYHIPSAMPQKFIPHQVMNWTYPDTEDEQLHYKVYLDLWEKGFYITSGAKFGGDYLAYPGDPLRFHSFYIIVLVPQGKKLTPFDIVCLGRLGATVKKTAVFCSIDGDSKVTYTSVKWAGIS